MSKRVFAISSIVFGFIGLAVLAPAQEALEPGPEHKALDFFAGKWEFTGQMKPGPMGPGGEIESKDTCEWFGGGFALVCRGEGSNPSGPTESLGIMSYDTDKKAYTYYGVESGMPATYATGKKDGDTWLYTSDSGGMKSRVTVKQTSPTSYDFKFEMSTDGSTWTTVMEGTGKKSST